MALHCLTLIGRRVVNLHGRAHHHTELRFSCGPSSRQFCDRALLQPAMQNTVYACGECGDVSPEALDILQLLESA